MKVANAFIAWSATVAWVATFAMTAPASAGTRYIREQHTVLVGEETEVWRLIWDGKPKPDPECGPGNVQDAFTVPCGGFRYSEDGKLFLVRSQDGKEIERLNLGPLFGDYSPELEKYDPDSFFELRRWPARDDDLDRDSEHDPKLLREIMDRRAPPVMEFGDYNRDGAATKFLVLVSSDGLQEFAAVGITRRNPHLHALRSYANPEKPLILPLDAWKGLLKGTGRHHGLLNMCGEHGSDVYRDVVVSAVDGIIHAEERELSCSDGAPKKIMKATPF